jgi:hypothetical protein
MGALQEQPHLGGIRLAQAVVERESWFDSHAGPRNHELVVHGHLDDGETVIVCVEAKAGEDLDRTVAQYAKDAQNKHARGEATDALERLAALLQRYVPYDPAEERVRLMRYQLLSTLAGTEAEATSTRAVMIMRELLGNAPRALPAQIHLVLAAVPRSAALGGDARD